MQSSGLLKNFIFNTVGGALPVVIALITIPLYVHMIGDARYDVLSIIFILLGYFRFLDVSPSRASANALSKLKSFKRLTAHPWLVPHGFTQTCQQDQLAAQDLWHPSLHVTVPDQHMSHNQRPIRLASIFSKSPWIEATPANDRQHPGNTYGWFEENFGRRFRLWLENCPSVRACCRNAAERPARAHDTAGFRPHRRYSH